MESNLIIIWERIMKIFKYSWVKVGLLFLITTLVVIGLWNLGAYDIFTFSEYVGLYLTIMTLVILVWYTIETQKYRKITDEILLSQKEQIEITTRPWIYLGNISFISPNLISFQIINSGKIPAQCRIIIEGLDLRDNRQNKLIELLERQEIVTTTVIPSDHIKHTDQKFSIILNNNTLLLLIHPQEMNIQFRMEYRSIVSKKQQYSYRYLCVLKIKSFDINKVEQDGDIVSWELQ